MGKMDLDVSAADLSANASTIEEKKSYEELLVYLNPIAKPLASRKLTKRVYKCIKKASRQKRLRRGVKEVQKFLNKGERGFVVLAGDTRPVEVICHLPIICEEKGVPYCYIPAKSDLGTATGTRRPTCCLLVKKDPAYEEVFNNCMEGIEKLPQPV